MATDLIRSTVNEAAMETTALINQLGVRHRAPDAYRALLRMGFEAVAEVLEGLQHTNPAVRSYCCLLLDHFLTPEAVSALLGRLQDPDPKVRQMALHALACDRCKEGDCRPSEAEVLPAALQILQSDEDYHTRAMAVEVVGLYVHTTPSAAHALIESHRHDPSPAVRKKAGWFVPGGTIYQRTRPRPSRSTRHPTPL